VSRFRLEVVAFNRRAISIYTRLGFTPVSRSSRAAQELGGRVVEWISMEVATEESGPISTRANREDDHG
jgi:ribosomal protein S18 acetylase RimI-like enzyme